MKLLPGCLASALPIAATFLSCAAWSGAAHATTTVTPTARVIVKYKTASPLMAQALSVGGSTASPQGPQHAKALSARVALTLSDGVTIDSRTQVLKATGITSEALVAKLNSQSDVEYATIDQRRYALGAPNDPLYASGQKTATPAVGQWYLREPTTALPASINAENAWLRTTGQGVVVAVLDSGARFDHPDLATKLYAGYDFVAVLKTANDGNGDDADASDPGDWVTRAEVDSGDDAFKDCVIEDSNWHGSQTASLIAAAANNGVGMAGVGADAMVLPVRVLGKCGGYDSDIVRGLRWAAGLSLGDKTPVNTHPAKVISMSLGSAGDCNPLYAAAFNEVTVKGAVVIAAAGNDSSAVNTPANCPGVISVAGLTHAGLKADYSSLGAGVTIAAPSGDCGGSTGCLYPILAATNSGITTPQTNTYSNGVDFSTGTSFAVPLVAGAAALMFSANPNLTPAVLIDKLKSSARKFPTSSGISAVSACPSSTGSTTVASECACTTSTCGAGMLDVNQAVAAVATSAPGVIPVISFDASKARANSTLKLDSVLTTLPSGLTATSYQWAVVSGNATISTANNAETATLSTGTAGTVVVSLTLTDNQGKVTTRQTSIAVKSNLTSISPGGASSPSNSAAEEDSGGGALGAYGLVALALAGLTLGLQRNLRPQRVSTPSRQKD